MRAPIYEVRPNIYRAVIPRIAVLLFLQFAAYVLISINLYYLFPFTPTIYYYLLMAVLFIITILLGIRTYLNAQKRLYSFYDDRIEFNGELKRPILYNEVDQISYHQSILDKLFNTCNIQVGPCIAISEVENSNRIYFYIQKLIEHHRRLGAKHACHAEEW